MIVKALVALILGISLSAGAQSQTPEKRVALIIAQQKYTNGWGELPIVAQDRRFMAASLKGAGFDVTILDNLQSKDAIQNAIVAFANKLDSPNGDSIGFFYYSGHGAADSGGRDAKNYLIPTGTIMSTRPELVARGLSLDDALEPMLAANTAAIFVALDACRNYPDAFSKSGVRGLAAVAVRPRMLIGFATQPGDTAPADGRYARVLAQQIDRAGLSGDQVFADTQFEVARQTGERQRPANFNNLTRKIVLSTKSLTNSTRQGQRILGPDPALGKKVGESFRDCPECPEMVIVPAGAFTMGSPDGKALGVPAEPGRHDDEGPQREVDITKPFAVGKFEVTFAEWDACIEDGACKERAKKDLWGRGAQPVINASWDDAQDFLEWIRKFTGRNYRLLSEAEWEYAARARTTTAYPWGPTIGNGNSNCDGCGSKWDNKQTALVGSFKPNMFGVFDMNGNVWEWVEDCVGSYERSARDASPRTVGQCGRRILRGGSWSSSPVFLRSAKRASDSISSRISTVGFRIARDL